MMKLLVVQSETTRRSITTPTTYSLSPAQCSPRDRTSLPRDRLGRAARCTLRPSSLSGECDGVSSSGVVASGVGGGERGDMGRVHAGAVGTKEGEKGTEPDRNDLQGSQDRQHSKRRAGSGRVVWTGGGVALVRGKARQAG